jgi:hypothetical protein
MTRTTARVKVILDEVHAAKLRRLAERTHTNPETLARSLLGTAIDAVDPDSSLLTEVLDGIDGAWARPSGGGRDRIGGWDRARGPVKCGDSVISIVTPLPWQ